LTWLVCNNNWNGIKVDMRSTRTFQGHFVPVADAFVLELRELELASAAVWCTFVVAPQLLLVAVSPGFGASHEVHVAVVLAQPVAAIEAVVDDVLLRLVYEALFSLAWCSLYAGCVVLDGLKMELCISLSSN
jgi:hypothetical protein